uniref:Uncharacterized protein n=1 Tax=Haplochromis burtoni TaxID=8153 RepID=A0A3Q2VBM4_HAPBU
MWQKKILITQNATTMGFMSPGELMILYLLHKCVNHCTVKPLTCDRPVDQHSAKVCSFPTHHHPCGPFCFNAILKLRF